MVKICEFSDSHLLYNQYALRRRGEDFVRAFNETCKDIAEQSPDIILFSGDLFNKAQPTRRAFNVARQGIDLLASSGATVLAVLGNHDASVFDRNDNWLLELEETTPVRIIRDFEILGFGKFAIAGLSWPSRRLRPTIARVTASLYEFQEGKNLPLVLFAHLPVADVVPGLPGTVSVRELRRLWGAYAMRVCVGHFHIPWVSDDGWLCSSGSTERCDIDEPIGGYQVFELDPSTRQITKPRLRPLHTYATYVRPFVDRPYDSIKDLIEGAPYGDQGIIRLSFHKVMPTLEAVREVFEDWGQHPLKLSIQDRTPLDEEYSLGVWEKQDHETPQQLLQRVLKAMGVPAEEVDLAQRVMDVISTHDKPTEDILSMVREAVDENG